MPGIFISYRREDSFGYAGRIYDRLSDHFGKENVFMDVDTIEAGQDFVEVLQKTVRSCDVLVAVIGKQWLTATDEKGKLRLEDPEDFVRLEVAAALDRKIRVIPTLVDGARMPRFQDLPDTLAPFARRNALEISNTAFRQGIGQLIEVIENAIRAAETPTPPKRNRVQEAPTDSNQTQTARQDRKKAQRAKEADTSPADTTIARESALPRFVPRLHWTALLMLCVITYGFFAYVWLLGQIGWTKRIDPHLKAMRPSFMGLGVAIAVALLGAAVSRIVRYDVLAAIDGVISILTFVGFQYRATGQVLRSLHAYAPPASPSPRALSWIPFPFSVLCIQYGLNRIAMKNGVPLWPRFAGRD